MGEICVQVFCFLSGRLVGVVLLACAMGGWVVWLVGWYVRVLHCEDAVDGSGGQLCLSCAAWWLSWCWLVRVVCGEV